MTRKRWALLLTIIIVAIIWNNSWQSAAISNDQSLWMAEQVQQLFGKNIFWGPLPYTNHMLRKMAHAFEFMCLGIAVYIMFGTMYIKKSSRWWGGLILCSIIAIVDEGIQMFSPGRAPMWQDIIIDSIGSVIGIILCSVVSLVFSKGKYW